MKRFGRLFRARLLRAAGVAAVAPLLCSAACGTTVTIVDGDDGEQAQGGATTSGSNPTTGPPMTSGQGGSGGVVFNPAGGNTGVGGFPVTEEEACFQAPPDGCPPVEDAPMTFGGCTNGGAYIAEWLSGPIEQTGACCYQVLVNEQFCGKLGRPLTGPNGPVSAAATSRQHDDVAAAWLRDGLFEHASVASFARFALELLLVGAPLDMIAAAHSAAHDEIRHAQLCFALARRLGAEDVQPGPLPIERAFAPRQSLAEVAAATVEEGCIGETIAAAIAHEQLERATDPDVRKALAIIVDDETRHAELAWRFVAWALRVGGQEVYDAVARTFANAGALSSVDPVIDGRLSLSQRMAVHKSTLLEVIAPCAMSLLARDSRALRSSAPASATCR